MKISMACVPALMLALVAPSVAQDIAPDVLLKAVTMEVIGIIERDGDIQAGDQAKITELVESTILPHFDFARMTRIAVARNWRLSTDEQKNSLTTEFKTLLVRTYSTALSSYRGQAIEFKRLRAAPGDTEVTVKCVMKQSGMEPLMLNYDMERMAAGWKVYDIKVDGISLITAYRETFASKVREYGVDGLIMALSDRNRQNDVLFRARQTESSLVPAIVRSLLAGAK